MNNIPNNPYGQVIMHYYEHNISKYQLHQMVKFPEIQVNRTDLKLADLLCKKHNFYTESLYLISTVQNLDRIRKNNISKLQPEPTVAGGENSQQRRLSKSVFPQKFISYNISQTGIDIEDSSGDNGDNVHYMEENNISEYRSNPMMEGGVIAVRFSAINMSSLQPLSKLIL